MLASTAIVAVLWTAGQREECSMEKFIADLVKDFDSGKVDRREFCQTVALAAVVYAAGESANAQAARGFKVLGINHISYRCPDYIKARDWYSSVLGMQVAPGRETEKRANLMFGPEPGKGGSYIVVRNTAAETKPPPQAVVDHVCYTVSNWDDAEILGALKAKGATVSGRAGDRNLLDPFNYYVQIASAATENAFRR
jgi:catechol 2,3-dioxygenase-like lactoylglutathione lyase family enzyme